MAIVRDNSKAWATGGSAATSYTYAYTVNSNTNGCLLVTIVEDGGSVDDITGVTYAGVSMSLIIKGARNGSYPVMSLYGLLAPASGANNVVISRSGTSGDMASAAISYTGVKQSGLPDASILTNSASATSVTGTITTVANNAIAIGFGACSGGSPTAGTGSTLVVTSTNNILLESTTFPITPAGSYSMTANCSSGNNGIIVASLAPFTASNTARSSLTLLGVS